MSMSHNYDEQDQRQNRIGGWQIASIQAQIDHLFELSGNKPSAPVSKSYARFRAGDLKPDTVIEFKDGKLTISAAKPASVANLDGSPVERDADGMAVPGTLKPQSAEIFVGVDKDISNDVIVKADGKYLGTAKQLLQFVGEGLVYSTRRRSVRFVPDPEWLDALRLMEEASHDGPD